MGDSVEDMSELMLNKNPKIGLSTRASYQLGMGVKTFDAQVHQQSHQNMRVPTDNDFNNLM